MRIIIIILGAFVLAMFQNCSDVQFAELNKQEKLVESLDFNDDGLGDGIAGDGSPILNTESEEESEEVSEEVSEEAPEEVVRDRSINGKKEPADHQNVNSGDDLIYVCILEGSGKSKRLGCSDRDLEVNGKTPRTVCTTRRGCEEIAGSVFAVKSVESRGYCGSKKGQPGVAKNKHVKKLSERALAELIDKL